MSRIVGRNRCALPTIGACNAPPFFHASPQLSAGPWSFLALSPVGGSHWPVRFMPKRPPLPAQPRPSNAPNASHTKTQAAALMSCASAVKPAASMWRPTPVYRATKCSHLTQHNLMPAPANRQVQRAKARGACSRFEQRQRARFSVLSSGWFSTRPNPPLAPLPWPYSPKFLPLKPAPCCNT